MQAYPRPYTHGKTWLISGAKIFKQAPFTWASAMAAYTVLNMVISSFTSGTPASLLFFPLGTCFFVSFLVLAQTTKSERFVTLSLLFSGFTRQPKSLIIIGLIEGVIILGSIWLWFYSDPAIGKAYDAFQKKPDLSLFDNVIGLSFFFLLGLIATTKILFIYAPPLAAFYEISAIKSIVFSAIGVMRNIKAWLSFLFALALLLLVSVAFLAIIASIIPTFALIAPQLFLLFFVCVIYPIAYGAIFTSFMDVYKIEANLPTVA